MDRHTATKDHWIEQISHCADSRDLQSAVLDFAHEWRGLPPADVKAIGWSLLCPRFYPVGREFIAHDLKTHFNDRDFSSAAAMKPVDFPLLVKRIRNQNASVLTTSDDALAAAGMAPAVKPLNDSVRVTDSQHSGMVHPGDAYRGRD